MEARQEFTRWVADYEGELRTFAARVLGSISDAEDALQDALLKAWAAFQTGTIPENERAWLFTILHRQMLSTMRRRTGFRRLLSRLRPRRSDDPRVGGTGVEAIVCALPFPMSAILLLRYAHDFSFPEIAEILGLPGGTVRTYAIRALDRLKKGAVR